ncbi:MAG: class I SAM-dependent methyltransferase [Verrucomicrobia bacterium]|nr:class I SAM-dependent methyltransferase [Verrucomicrobiota bacterium]
MKKQKNQTTSWEKASSWYDGAVGKTGHYYHENVILPNLSRLLALREGSETSYLDLACGQGILSRYLPKSSHYVGVDLSPSLIASAREKNVHKNHTFVVSDITKPLQVTKKDFDFCTIILALQNVEHPLKAFKNAAKHLVSGGKLVLVMNHPCFRIPKQSSWEIDKEKQIQYRRVDGYYQSRVIPIQMHPSQGQKSATTPSFHHPLSKWTLWLHEAGFAIECMEEWCSDKKSTGKNARREDVSREEIPLFLTITAFKYP